MIQTQDSHPELWETPLMRFGLVHALQRSVWQQLQLRLAQLSSVVQPFSPLSVEEKKQSASTNAGKNVTRSKPKIQGQPDGVSPRV